MRPAEAPGTPRKRGWSSRIALLVLPVAVAAASLPWLIPVAHAMDDACASCVAPSRVDPAPSLSTGLIAQTSPAKQGGWLFDTAGFPPRWRCGDWSAFLGWLHIVSDAAIWGAYMAIPIALSFFVLKRRTPLPIITWLFIAFIFSCGVGHLIEAVIFWEPVYRLAGVWKSITAIVSWATVAAIIPMAPKVLRWPTLDDVNLRLREEIAERERAEQQVRDIVEASPSGVCVVDQSGTIILVNRAIEQLFGYTREELVGQGVDMLVPEGDRSRHADLRAGFMAAPEARPMGAGRDLFARRKDGSQIAVEIGLCPLDIRGQGAVLASVIDVTERRRAQAQLKEYAERLEISNAELEKFAYVVSHDIKAPLRGISSVAQWLAQDFAAVVDKESKENLDLMLERTDRLGRLINGILDYSRAGRGDPDIEQIDSSALIDDVIDSIDPPPSIRVLREGTFPVVVFNETKLRQVFQNLIDNAIQHLGKPRGEIIASCREAGEFFEFSVRDDGVGIPERHFERIFELFQTLRPKDETGTTGAGLAIAKRIIETNGGAIRVASTEGRGTEFVFTVPKLRRLGVTEGTDEAVSA